MLLGRHAGDERFASPSSRTKYPFHGLLRKAWEGGSFFVHFLPNPSGDQVLYFDAQKKQGYIPKSVSRQLRMPSRSYALFSLADPISKQKTAVVCLESTDPDKFARKHKQLRAYVRGKLRMTIFQFINDLNSFEPSPEIAERRGF